MIQPNELRFGNWVSSVDPNMLFFNTETPSEGNDVDIVFGIEKDGVKLFNDGNYSSASYFINFYLVDIMPIPINPKVLKMFGFELDELRCWGKINLPNSPNVLLINCGDGIGHGTVWLKNKYGSINLPSVFHLHQLQNLYFALTGEELSIFI